MLLLQTLLAMHQHRQQQSQQLQQQPPPHLQVGIVWRCAKAAEQLLARLHGVCAADLARLHHAPVDEAARQCFRHLAAAHEADAFVERHGLCRCAQHK